MKRQAKFSKLLSLALIFCTALALTLTFHLPSSAAEEPEIVWGASDGELTEGGTLYEACVAAYDGTGVYFRLQKDITRDSAMEPWILANVITLDLSGHTLSLKNGFGIIGGGLILEDSVGDGELIASDGAALFVSTSDTEFSTITINGGTLIGKEAIHAYSPCEFRLVGGTLCGSRYGDVHISDTNATVIVTGSTFTSSVAAFAYGAGGVIDLSNATGNAYTIKVLGTMMVNTMETDKVILPDGFALFDDEDTKIANATVQLNEIVTAKQELPAGGPDTDDPGNSGNESSDDKNDSGVIVIIIFIVIAILSAGAFIFVWFYKRKKETENKNENEPENEIENETENKAE